MLRGCSRMLALLLFSPATAAALAPCGVQKALLALLHDQACIVSLPPRVSCERHVAAGCAPLREVHQQQDNKTCFAHYRWLSGSQVMQPEGANGNKHST